MPTEDSEYETDDETEEEDEYEPVNMGFIECPVPEYATHPGDYDYISEGEFSLFRQNPQLLIDTIAHAVEEVRDIDHQLRCSDSVQRRRQDDRARKPTYGH